jgi:hypothetical protein
VGSSFANRVANSGGFGNANGVKVVTTMCNFEVEGKRKRPANPS